MTWNIVTLPRYAEWTLDRLLSADEVTWPNNTWHQAELADLVTAVIPVSGLVDDGQPIVIPGGLSRETGQVVRTNSQYVGRIYEMRGNADGLQVGDLLVPRYSSSPALLLGEAHTGLGFAGSFHALRCSDYQVATWLWAALSSGFGQRARSEASTDANTPVLTRGRLLELRIPWPPAEERQEKVEILHPLVERSQSIDMRRDEVRGSWWRTANLEGAERWDVFIILAEPDLLLGVPLAELCEDMGLGKAVRGHVLPTARPNWLRVYTARSVRAGHIDDLWLDPSAQALVAEPGDLLIPSVGATAVSTLCAERAAVDRDVIRCRVRVPRVSGPLVHYMNSDRGQALRRILTAGVIPRLTLKAAREFPILEDIARGETDSVRMIDLVPLSERLDDVLWS